jgi:hypothetical protein
LSMLMTSFRSWMLGVLGLLLPLLRILYKEKGISGIMGNNLKTKKSLLSTERRDYIYI